MKETLESFFTKRTKDNSFSEAPFLWGWSSSAKAAGNFFCWVWHVHCIVKTVLLRQFMSFWSLTCIYIYDFHAFFPKQLTVGVLNATLDLAALVLVGVVGFLGSEVVLSPVVSHCLRSSPFMWGVGVGWCGRLLGL